MKKIIIITILFSISLYGENYYVDNNAPQQGDGSIERPWQTILEGVENLSPGDTLFIRGDSEEVRIYEQQESIVIPTDGKKGEKIVVRNYPQENVEIKNVTPSSPLLRINSKDYWLFFGLNFNQNKREADCIQIRDGSKGVEFKNCVIKNGKRDGIDIGEGDSIVVEGCKIFNFYLQGDDAHGIVLEDGKDNRFINNEIYNCTGDCIQIIHGNSTNTIIRDNTMYTTLGSECENAVDVKRTEGKVVIKGNVCYGFRGSHGSDGTAIIVHAYCPEIEIDSNIIYDSEGGIRVGSTSHGIPHNVRITRNLIYDIVEETQRARKDGIYIDGGNNIFIYNNTLHNIVRYALYCSEEDPCTNLVVRNNIFSHAKRVRFRNLYGTITIDHNGYFSVERIPPETTLAVVGEEAGFVSLEAKDFRLEEGSPCIDKGVEVGFPYYGDAPDLGWWEYQEEGVEGGKREKKGENEEYKLIGRREMYDKLGRRVNSSLLPTGIYFIRISQGKGIFTKKIIVIK